MRILHILSSPIYSGAETVACEIIDSYSDKAEMTYVSPDGIIKDVLKEKDIKFLPIKEMNILEIRKVVGKYKPDIVHAHDFRASVVCAFSFLGIPVISHLHNNNPWLKRINPYSLIFLLASIRLSIIIGVSDSIKEEYIFKRFIHHKFSVFSNPIDTKRIINSCKLYSINEKYDLIFLGRLNDEKSPIRFIKIVKQLVDKMPNIRAVIVGDGKLQQECINEIERLGLSENINMVGFLNNPFPYLLNSRLMIVPSKWEGFGLAAVEAMSLGKPVLATKVGGLKEVVNDDCGMLCNKDGEFFEEAYKLLTNKEYYKMKSIGAKERANKLDNKKEYATNISKLYKDIKK